MQTIEELQEVARKAGDAIGKIQTAERRAANGSKVGKVFKYRNSYSCPEKPSDYWWLYSKVTRMDSDGFLYTMQFETDKSGDIRVNFDRYSYHTQGHTEIKPVEFKRAWTKLFRKLKAV